ncbi:MAG: CDP-alcohol phosphatidyltransferase family protein [Clostridia bacterium]|nr:CDP-alcohol phosphatidyltransferase family protein [Clostridia bacterium]
MSTNSPNPYQHKIITIPNLISLFRLLLIPLFAWLYMKGEYAWTVAVLGISGLSDIADGIIARKCNMTSDLGKVLDPVADKLTQFVMMLCLLTRFPSMRTPLIVLIVREITNALTGAMVIRKTGMVLGAEWHGKAATVMIYIMMLTHVIWYSIPVNVSGLLCTLATLMIIISLVLYTRRNVEAAG